MLLVLMASILPILGFLGISVLKLGRGKRQTDGRTDGHRGAIYNAPYLTGRVYN